MLTTTATITGDPRAVARVLDGVGVGSDVLVHLDEFVLSDACDQLLERGITVVPDPRLTVPPLGLLLSSS